MGAETIANVACLIARCRVAFFAYGAFTELTAYNLCGRKCRELANATYELGKVRKKR